MKRPLLRWLAPLSAAVVFVGGGAAVSAVTSAAHADLPATSAARLLADLAHPRVTGFSGQVQQSADLGLPALPAGMAGEGSSAGLSSLLSGSHVMRVWYAAPGRSRIALLGDGSESDLVSDGHGLWSWSSAERTATHWTLPSTDHADTAARQAPAAMSGMSAMTAMTPLQLAQQALRAIKPTTKVTANGSARVAGRPAYLLTISPRTTQTLVDSIQIAIDSTTHLPTRVRVYAVGHSDPALSVGFTHFDPATPSSSRFSFTPPPGAKVVEKRVPVHDVTGSHQAARTGDTPPAVSGSGWSSVVVLPAAAGRQLLRAKGPQAALLGRLSRVSGTWGSGRLLRGTLLSVVLSDDGRVALGAVPPTALYAALER